MVARGNHLCVVDAKGDSSGASQTAADAAHVVLAGYRAICHGHVCCRTVEKGNNARICFSSIDSHTAERDVLDGAISCLSKHAEMGGSGVDIEVRDGVAVAVKGAGPVHVFRLRRDGNPTADAAGADGSHVDVGGEFGTGIGMACGSLVLIGRVGSVHPVSEPRKLRGIGDLVGIGRCAVALRFCAVIIRGDSDGEGVVAADGVATVLTHTDVVNRSFRDGNGEFEVVSISAAVVRGKLGCSVAAPQRTVGVV